MFRAKLKKKPEQCLPKPDPMEAPDYTEADVQALKACFLRGDATKDQQLRVGKFVIENICGTYDSPLRKTKTDTYIAGGKQRVGQMLVWFLNAAPTLTPIERISARAVGKGDV